MSAPTIRSIRSLSATELRLCARDQADAGEDCVHGFDSGTPEAAAWEQAYQQRLRELGVAIEA